ncbi:MAG TPA: alpha/beta hydrolase [Methylocella sp.]|nr:alpha/beta hydrolase [Methylocella sp.]
MTAPANRQRADAERPALPAGGARAGAGRTRIALFLAACLAAAASAGCGSAEQSVSPVADAMHVDAGGAKLYIEVRGDHADAPLLVWLHGGPGGAERPLFRYFNDGLERRFLVVYYDQRGAGLSFDPEEPLSSINIAQHVADLSRIVSELRERYRRGHVLLVGHSWGAVLGMLYAKAHPETVAGLICVAPAVSFSEQQRREFAYDVEEAAKHNDEAALRELRAIGPPPYETSGPMLQLENITARYRGVEYQARSHAAIVVEGVLRGLVTPWEIFRIIKGSHRSLEAMHQELMAFDLRREVSSLDIPIAFFLGRHDHHSDASLAAEYFAMLRAPRKEIVWFEDSAHNVPFDEPELFNARIAEVSRRLRFFRDELHQPPASP